ncbi:hypothetical protein A2U01_0116045, partial [Trifolium medium]|nr:hypothetical protein [Trifolium medium]
VRRVRGHKRERDAERPPRPQRRRWRQPVPEPEIHDEEALDLKPLQAEMPKEYDNDEEMHEAQYEPEA